MAREAGPTDAVVTLLAPAKLNLGLTLLNRRPDGYHEIETILLPLRLYDRLELEPTDGPGIKLEGKFPPSVPRDATNLAVRAARTWEERVGVTLSLKIRLDKRIPAAAGLGGGSSDAASVILGLEALFDTPLGDEECRALARGLGADVPFFLSPTPALGRGVGDRMEPLEGLPEMWWVLAVFPFGLQTREIYREASIELTLPRQGSSIASLLGPAGPREPPENDLEETARRRHPEIAEARRALERVGASVTGMTGSGPTVYGRFESREDAERSARKAEFPAGARALITSSPASDSENWGWGVAKW